MNSNQSSLFKLFLCSLGVFVSYSFYGYFQEKITKTRYGPDSERFSFTISLVLLQCVGNSIVALIAGRLLGKKDDSQKTSSISYQTFALCAVSYIGAMFASNQSLQHVNYPTQVLAKSAKPISVMAVGFLLGGFRYPLQKCLYVLMISVGVVFFVYKEPVLKQKNAVVSGGSYGIGEILLLASLTLDGLTSLMQERMRSFGRVGPYRMMFQMNAWSIVYLTAGLVYTQEFSIFYSFILRFPNVLSNMVLFGAASAVGQLFIFTTVTSFGPLMCSIVTTTRKFFSILLSVVIFQHPMLPRQWVGTVLVFTGLFLDMRADNMKRKAR